MPHRDELFVCLQQPDSIFTAGLYLGAVPWAGHWAGGDLNPCPFCTVSISHSCTYCIAKVSGTALSTREYSTPLGRCVGVIPLLLSKRHHLGVFKSPWPVVLQYIMAGEWIGVIIDYFCVGRAEVFGFCYLDESAAGHFVLIHSQSWMWVFGWIYNNFILFTQGHAGLQNCYNWLIVLLCQVTKYSAFFYSAQEDLVSLHRSKLLK